MKRAARDRFFAWCEHHCQAPVESLQPVKIEDWAIIEALWPLNDSFRPNFAAFSGLHYDPAFEPHADEAIDRYLATGNWGPVSVETWRVLLERHCQALELAMLKMAEGNLAMSVPAMLPPDALHGAAVLWWLYGMKLPFEPADRSAHEVPAAR